MTVQPSPGPWHVGRLPPAGWRYICDVDGNTIAAVSEWNESGELIQDFAGEHAPANAQVLAAARDTLAALIDLVAAIEDGQYSSDQIEEARDAIAKATGGAR
jgi:hypothetical protein